MLKRCRPASVSSLFSAGLPDAAEMVREIKGFTILQGYRGQEPVDVAFLEGLILRVSEFIERNPRINELDINPLIAYENGAASVDAKIIIEP
jgi:acyl-CoA synthetase (NDP forming)